MPEERRVVTVLFADVTGSTALGETTDPEDTRAVLGRYYAIAREVVAEHGGTLEKFIGDAVMAVFGMPTAHGDDAERALAAALALRERVAKDAQTATLALRIGVNTGEVVAAREKDGGDFLITGDAVNVAARLQQHAEPGAIFVGERTLRAASGFRFSEEQPVAVRGRRESVIGAALVERIVDRRAPRAPFQGREHDLAQLDLVARRAFGERRPQLVTITAPAGTGKSRLVEEFASRLAPADITVATAQCLPYGSAVTFLPLRGLVRGLLRIGRDDDVVAPLRASFIGAGHSEPDAARLTSLVGVTLGDTGETERVEREEIFAAWRLLVEVVAARGPLVIVFEDLHWASDTLLDLVEHVTTSHGSAPLVMIALARPELIDRRPTWGGGRRNFSSLALEPLSPAETLQLVTVLTEGVPGPIAHGIVERAGGNPFFAGELVRAYLDRRRAGALDEDIRLPDTVHATVLARIDGLPADERSVLELAAVAGRTARVGAVHALVPDRREAQIEMALAALADRDLLVAQGAGTYTFRHIVIREVAYATLPRAERVRAHLRLAQWFEHDAPAHGDELTELVAYHYRQAIALSPGGRVPDGLPIATVVRAFERAARSASAGGAYAEAAQQLREAIRLAPPEDLLRLNELLGDLLRYGDAAVDGYREAFERWRAMPDGDPHLGARLMVKRLGVMGRWSGSLSRVETAAEFEALAAEARALLAQAPDGVLEARLTCALAFQVNSRRSIDRATVDALVHEAEAALRLFEEGGDVDAQSEALDALGALYRSGYGDYETAMTFAKRRLASADRLGILERYDAWNVLVWDLTLLGRFDVALRTYDEFCRSARPGEPEYLRCHAAAWAGYAGMLSGRWDEAAAMGDALVAWREEAPDTVKRFTTLGWIGALRVARARLDTTRLARLQNAFAAVAELGQLGPGSILSSYYRGLTELDRDALHEWLRIPAGRRENKAEAISLLVLELGDSVPESELATIEAHALADPALLTLRIRLARALNGSDVDLRTAIAALDEGNLVADAARAAALLALRTRDAKDRADAERRLTALGDRAYLQKIEEEW